MFGEFLESDSVEAGENSLADNRKIYLSGVPKSVDEQALRRYFEDILGEVEDVNIIEQNTIGPFRYGFVTLKTQEDVDYCMQLEFITIKG